MYISELGKAAIEGIISIPMDLAYGVRRTYEDVAGGKAVQAENRAERERGMRAIKMAINFGSSDVEAIAKKAGVGASFMISRVSTQVALTTLVSQKLAKEIAAKAVARRAIKFGVGVAASALLIQGFIEKASEASKRLQRMHPKIYSLFKKSNLDMAYIIVEDSMAPILKAIQVHDQNIDEFNKLIENIINDY